MQPHRASASLAQKPRIERKASFARRRSDLKARSSSIAARLVGTLQKWSTFSGHRPRVYLAPLPALCIPNRRSKSFVIPQ